MVSREEYLRAKAIVDEYENEEHDSMDEDSDFGPEECDDCGKENCMCHEIDRCRCGAWAYSSAKKQMVLVSDCCC